MLRYLLLAPVLVAAVTAGCTPATTDHWPDAPGPKVVASFAPVQCFALNVAGGDATVRPLMTSQGPHDFQSSPADARTLARADLLFINGLQLEDALVNRLVSGSGNGKLKPVALAGRIKESDLLVGGCDCNHEHGDHKHDHDHDAFDPHVWLGMPHAETMVEGVRDGLKAADAAHAADYDRRAAEYIARLRKMTAKNMKLFDGKTDRKFIVFHESLNYFAKTYDLTVAGVIQEVPGHEPTPKQLAALVEMCVAKKVRVIAVEPQYSAKTAANDRLGELRRKGVENPVIVTIDPLETCPPSEMSAEWYEAKMRANAQAMAGALK